MQVKIPLKNRLRDFRRLHFHWTLASKTTVKKLLRLSYPGSQIARDARVWDDSRFHLIF